MRNNRHQKETLEVVKIIKKIFLGVGMILLSLFAMAIAFLYKGYISHPPFEAFFLICILISVVTLYIIETLKAILKIEKSKKV